MSYIQKSLGDGETIIARAHFHVLYLTAAWLSLLIPGALLLAALADAQSQPDPYTVAAGLLLLLGVIVFFKLMIRKWSTEIGITSHRFVEKYGLLSMKTNEIALPNIEGVKVNQSILGRIFGYGTVKIEGTGVDSVTTPAIADPVGFVRAIQTAKEHIAGLTATPRS
jgi:Bacterial PH domain